ncbi:hypothetical protein HMP06_0400 [Sphingomonas sp. HMP6]|nr:hypothetical protein HMP06_0400 [Sphingomonas sp. HMP6]
MLQPNGSFSSPTPTPRATLPTAAQKHAFTPNFPLTFRATPPRDGATLCDFSRATTQATGIPCPTGA